MKSIIRKIIIFCVIPFALQAASQRPNIVFVLSDDQAWTDYGFMGHKDIKTPHLDKLAREGTRMTQFYVHAVCSPTRAAYAM